MLTSGFCGTTDRSDRSKATRDASEAEQDMDDAIFAASEQEEMTPLRAAEMARSAELLRAREIARLERMRRTEQDIVAGHEKTWNGKDAITQDQAEEIRYLKSQGHTFAYIAKAVGISERRCMVFVHRERMEKAICAI